jgi:hypothetical protein
MICRSKSSQKAKKQRSAIPAAFQGMRSILPWRFVTQPRPWENLRDGGAVLDSGGCRSQRLVVAFGLDPVLVPVMPFERRVSFHRFRVCLISELLIFKICSQWDPESAPDFI